MLHLLSRDPHSTRAAPWGLPIVGVCFGLCTWVAWLPRATACSPGFHAAGITAIVPSGDTHPSNAAIILRGSMLHTSSLQATIDGAEATVGIDEALSHEFPPDGAYLVLAIRLTPEPTPGQAVRLWGQPCVFASCSVVDVNYVAAAADTSAPPAPSGWWDFRTTSPNAAHSVIALFGLLLVRHRRGRSR